MVARLLYLAVMLGACSLVSPGLAVLSVAQAAPASGTVSSVPLKRPMFRPWSYTSDQPATPPRASAALSAPRNTTTRPGMRRGQSSLIFDSRAGARKAVPITRGQELGLRFRPDERASPYPYAGSGLPQTGTLGPDSEQGPFRPTQRRRKPTYEELQAEAAADGAPPMPAMPYPALPAPPLPPAFGRPWPAW